MSFINTMIAGHEGISAEYSPGFEHEDLRVPGTVRISLDGTARTTSMSLSIEDARSLLAQLPGVLAEHDAAVSSDKAA
ncbi:hypothetical protein IU449_14195 [Nocardia higoensis]|uniref:Uncharacterized protein n=1 Tax=Nocardia higoensis TaxID=228599 RepID=A0ABS0DDK2_9NOCA|nr:hypothetical protein [Nocardia higoensis]MBF6355682.1 hypothetical protein [Nocardia higoensis]